MTAPANETLAPADVLQEPDSEAQDARKRPASAAKLPTKESAAAAKRRERILTVLVPIFVIAGLIALWQVMVTVNNIPHYILPGPGLVVNSLMSDWHILLPAMVILVYMAVFEFSPADASATESTSNASRKRIMSVLHLL